MPRDLPRVVGAQRLLFLLALAQKPFAVRLKTSTLFSDPRLLLPSSVLFGLGDDPFGLRLGLADDVLGAFARGRDAFGRLFLGLAQLD